MGVLLKLDNYLKNRGASFRDFPIGLTLKQCNSTVMCVFFVALFVTAKKRTPDQHVFACTFFLMLKPPQNHEDPLVIGLAV